PPRRSPSLESLWLAPESRTASPVPTFAPGKAETAAGHGSIHAKGRKRLRLGCWARFRDRPFGAGEEMEAMEPTETAAFSPSPPERSYPLRSIVSSTESIFICPPEESG